MKHRLQVLIPEQLNARITRAARRQRTSKGEWVRRVLEENLRRGGDQPDPLEQMRALNGPTADIEQMLAEIEAGRREERLG
jgi:hypothetical protein